MPSYQEKTKRDQPPVAPADSVDPRLGRALHFDAHDLFCNREGYISKAQQERLHNSQWFVQMDWPATLVLGVLAVMVVGACLVGMMLLASPVNLNKIPPMLVMVAGIIVIPLIITLIINWYQYTQLQADLDKGDVSTLDGPIRLDIYSGRRQADTPRCTLTVNWQRFKIDKPTLLAFRDGEPYRIYFTPTTKRILSTEPLDDTEGAHNTYSDQAGDPGEKRKR